MDEIHILQTSLFNYFIIFVYEIEVPGNISGDLMWLCYTTTVAECLLFSLWELVSLHDPDQGSQETVAVIVGYLKVFAYEWMQALMHFRVPRGGSNIVCGVHCKKWLSDFQMLLINVFTLTHCCHIPWHSQQSLILIHAAVALWESVKIRSLRGTPITQTGLKFFLKIHP